MYERRKGGKKTPSNPVFSRPHSFVPLSQACICTENPLTDCWSAVLIWSLHQSPDCRIGNETVKLLLSGRRHQILFSFYYLSDSGPTFADKTIFLHIIIWNISSLDCILPLLLLFFSSAGEVCSQGNSLKKHHKNACFSGSSVINSTTRNNSSTWLPRRRYTWGNKKLSTTPSSPPPPPLPLPHRATTQPEMDLLLLWLTGAAEHFFSFFFCSPEEIKGASLGNGGHKYCLCKAEDTQQGEESGRVFFLRIIPGVSEGHTYANI